MIRNLITDLDGTLLDTAEANVTAYLRAFEDAGRPIPREEYMQHFGLRFDALVEQLAPDLDARKRAEVRQLKQQHYREVTDLVKPNRPLIEFLSSMRRTHQIGLATTASRSNAEHLLEHFGLLELFNVLVYGEDVTNGKPDPECYHLCISRLGGLPRETLIFEDSAVGVAAAEAADAHVILVRIQ